MSSIERIKTLLMLEGVSRAELAKKSGIKKDRWETILKGRGRISLDEIEALERLWPEYGYWIAYGKELTECGQISPIRKKL